MQLSKFEKQRFAQMPVVRHDTSRNGNQPRERVPRTTQVKRAWWATGHHGTLKAWARGAGVPLATEWLEAK